MTEAKLQNLLSRTRDLIKHHQEMENQKGEKFNVFSILQVESKENLTHSNFIAELLDPKGSHLKGSCFLELFLESVSLKLDDFDFQNCRVRKEHPTGKIDWEEETGGRLDLVISDANQDILIENKVFAGDQKLQLLRYHNSKVRKGYILYLTLDGREPSEYSRGSLVSGVDYHPISYKVEINNWLEKCQKEAYNAPIVRETIRQYQLLIQKLTGTMLENEQEKLQALIIDNLDEAKLIAQNYTSAKASVAHSFRADLIEHLKKGLPDSFQIDSGSPTDKPTSQIWIKPTQSLPEGFYFGIESFSVTNRNHHDGKLLIGTFNLDGHKNKNRIKFENEFKWVSDWWFDTSVFDDFESTKLDFSQNDFVKKLAKDTSFRSGLLEYLTSETKKYLDKQIRKIEESIK
jgi:hypothetical protein